MSILKDASATAIYGSRGANGVIIVTTKSGQIGKGKANFSYTGEYSVQILEKKIALTAEGIMQRWLMKLRLHITTWILFQILTSNR